MASPPDGIPLDETVAHGGLEGASSRDASPSFLPGDLLADRYRIESFLARGGMGEVYRAQDLELGVPVALKTIRPEIAADPAALRSFKQEVLTARSVTHSNVCRIYDLGRHRDDARDVSFLTMEFLPGETLSARLRAGGRLSGAEALPIVQQLAEGLDAAHRAGIVHRDFKSSNVILAPGKSAARVVITDFGLAMATGWTGDSTGGTLSFLSGDDTATIDSLAPEAPQICGTPAYMAPEQVRGERLGPAADLYALGVTLFELRTGQLPFLASTVLETARLRLTTPPPRPSTIAELEPAWDDAIVKLLALDPAERFASAGEAVRALLGHVAVVDDAKTSASQPKHSLPAEHDAFVGRRSVLASLAEALEPAAALVTLLGVGGTGKTRLARRYGWESLERWAGGVWFCDLIDARDGNGIASAVAAALSVSLAGGDPVVQLGHAIAGRGRALIILDNFEQVVAEAEATVRHWRARSLETSFLVTTRERLQLEGENVVEVEPLDPETEAVELFQERARAHRPGFEVTTENRATVIEIVRLLDGLPLAIELAASRVRMLSLDQLRERLGDRFAVLAGSKRGRHGTLRGTLDWSWSLLTPWEQSAVAQASIFQGGFTLDAAEALIDLSAFEDAPMVLDVIQSLVDKSWLRARVVHQAPRFTMYATVQDYAAEKASADGGDATAHRHGEYFATMGTEKAIEALDRHGGAARRAALHLELDNLIAACRASIARGSEEIAAATYLAAALVLELRGPAGVSIALGEQVLPLVNDLATRGRVLTALAWSERLTGRMREARAHCESALTLAREMGDRPAEARRLRQLGTLHLDQGRTEEARSCFDAALDIHQEAGIRGFEGILRINLGTLDRRCGRFEEARAHGEVALALARKEGHQRLEGTALGSLGMVLRDLGRFEESRSHYEAALTLNRSLGDREAEGIVLGNLGGLQFEVGLIDEARASMEAALAIHREVGSRRAEGHTIGSLGAIHTSQGHVDGALACLEAALTIHREVGARQHVGGVHGYLANLYHEHDRFEEARPHYEAAIAIYREVGDRRFEGAMLGRLGYLHLDQGNLEDARSCINAGLEVLRAIGDQLELAAILCRRGNLEIAEGNLDAARSSLEEAAQISQAFGEGRAQLKLDLEALREALASAVESRDR